jgi:hypothetical protein
MALRDMRLAVLVLVERIHTISDRSFTRLSPCAGFLIGLLMTHWVVGVIGRQMTLHEAKQSLRLLLDGG